MKIRSGAPWGEPKGQLIEGGVHRIALYQAYRRCQILANWSVALLLWREAVYYDAPTAMSEAVRTMMRMDAEAAQETAAQADPGFERRDLGLRGRDLGPRAAHALLPVAGKGSSDWSYAPIPVIGPLAGGALAGWLLRLLVVT